MWQTLSRMFRMAIRVTITVTECHVTMAATLRIIQGKSDPRRAFIF